MIYIDTHCHLDGEEFRDDLDAVVQRAREAGCRRVLIPAIDLASCHTVLDTCRRYPDFCLPMLGLHPEEVRADWQEQLSQIKLSIINYQQLPSAKSVSTSIGAVSSNRNSCKPSNNRCSGP